MSLEDKANKSSKKKLIHFLGAKTNPMPYLKRANLIALTSSSEAFPMIILEAIALNIKIVTTPTLGALEILSNYLV